MRYEEFRSRLEEALQQVSLFSFARPRETVDLSGPVRRFRIDIGSSLEPEAEPFSISGRVSFRWDPFEAARSYTCEEDLLNELYYRLDHPPVTAPRLLRVNIGLHATLPYGSTTPMPAPELWESWSDSLEARLDDWLPRAESAEEPGLLPAVVSWRSDLPIASRVTENGTLSFDGMSVRAYRLIQIPRLWDDPAKAETEDDGAEDLEELAGRFKGALEAWKQAVSELGGWVKYGPPAEVKEDPLEGVDDDDEPEVTH